MSDRHVEFQSTEMYRAGWEAPPDAVNPYVVGYDREAWKCGHQDRRISEEEREPDGQ